MAVGSTTDWSCGSLLVYRPAHEACSEKPLEGNLKIILVGVQSVSHFEYRTVFPCGCLKNNTNASHEDSSEILLYPIIKGHFGVGLHNKKDRNTVWNPTFTHISARRLSASTSVQRDSCETVNWKKYSMLFYYLRTKPRLKCNKCDALCVLCIL